MNKKNKTVFFLCLFLSIMLITESAKGFSFDIFVFTSDKDIYYNNENININASWELFYEPSYEISYFQVQIFDIFDNILWNSSEHHETGFSEKNWTINIEFLNISFSNYTNTLFIKLFHFYKDQNGGGSPINTFREIIIVNVLKRNVMCQLIGFKSVLKYGDYNFFTAKFYSTDNNTYLINETFHFEIFSNTKRLYQKDLRTNESGEISFNISTISHLNLGDNNIIFSIRNNIIYNNATFSYDIFVEKAEILVEILRFDNNLENDRLITIKLYFYFFNQSIKPLNNQILKTIIYNDLTLEYEDDFKTNQSGFVDIEISPNNFRFKENEKMFYVDIIFNGTKYLKNKTITLNFKIQNFLSQGVSNLFFTTNIFLFTILIILFTSICMKVNIRKRTKFKLIRDLIFKF